jgi:hypothetical protein
LSADWYLNVAYQASSNYGLSVWRPLIWLFGLFASGGAAFYAMHTTMPITALHAAALSFANIFPFVPITREIASGAGLLRTEKIIGVAQTLFGTPLLFLLVLALRNRFRMR